MNVLNHKVVPQFELGQAIHRERIDRSRRFVGRPWDIGRRGAVFNAVAVVCERLRAGSVDAFSIILLQAREIAVGD